jgi:hypothetical protein
LGEFAYQKFRGAWVVQSRIPVRALSDESSVGKIIKAAEMVLMKMRDVTVRA